MKRLRALWRGGAVFVITVSSYVAWALGSVPLLLAPRARRPWRRTIFRSWGRWVCRALNVRVVVEGELPSERVCIVANHLSYLDIPLLASLTDTVFVSKAEVADWPIVGRGAKAMGTIFLVRERKRELPDVNRQIERALERGDSVTVFPEGTSTRGDAVLAFRPSLLAPAAHARVPVRCAVLHYATAAGDPPASTHVCWWGDMAFSPHVAELLRLERIEARVTFLDGTHVEPDRKLLAEKLWAAVNSRFRPLT